MIHTPIQAVGVRVVDLYGGTSASAARAQSVRRAVRTLAAAGLIDHRDGRVRLVYDALSPKDQGGAGVGAARKTSPGGDGQVSVASQYLRRLSLVL